MAAVLRVLERGCVGAARRGPPCALIGTASTLTFPTVAVTTSIRFQLRQLASFRGRARVAAADALFRECGLSPHATLDLDQSHLDVTRRDLVFFATAMACYSACELRACYIAPVRFA